MKHSFFISALFLCLSIALFPSCNPARQLEKGKLRKKSTPFLLKKLNQNRIDAEWFSSKAKVEFDGAGQRLKASATIRMRKDSVIWMAVKKIGIEAARVQITPDSIYFLNRLTRQYAVWDLNYLKQQFNLPLGFGDLQELFLGNPVMIKAEDLQANVQKVQHQLSGEQAGVNTEYLLNGLTYLIEKTTVGDPREGWEVQIDQGEYGAEPAYAKFPYFRNFAIDAPETGAIDLTVKFLKIELNVPKSIQFEIPSRYTKMP